LIFDDLAFADRLAAVGVHRRRFVCLYGATGRRSRLASMFVSRVYARPEIGWAWAICLACADTTKEVKAAA